MVNTYELTLITQCSQWSHGDAPPLRNLRGESRNSARRFPEGFQREMVSELCPHRYMDISQGGKSEENIVSKSMKARKSLTCRRKYSLFGLAGTRCQSLKSDLNEHR